MAETPDITTPPSTGKKGNFFTKNLGGLPVWAWGAILLAGVGIGIYILKKQQGNSASSSGATIGPGTAANSLANIPTSEEVPNTTGDQVFVVQPPTPVTPTTTTTPTSSPNTMTIRAQNPASSWDKNNSGVPGDSSPGGSVSTLIPYGATVDLISTTSGPSDNGNTAWNLISYNGNQAYVNGSDFAGAGGGAGRVIPKRNILSGGLRQ